MIKGVTWDVIAVWILFGVAVFFLSRPLIPVFKKKKNNNHTNCNKCH